MNTRFWMKNKTEKTDLQMIRVMFFSPNCILKTENEHWKYIFPL